MSSSYDRLTALDNSFLMLERDNAYMHVASTQIYDGSSLRDQGSSIGIDKLRELTAASLYQIPRYRQKLSWIPFQNRAVWHDDDRFNLDYHIRHTALPRPGTEATTQATLGQNYAATSGSQSSVVGVMACRWPRK